MALAQSETLFGAVVEKLRAAARADRQVDAAQLHLINLADIIKSVGPHWQKMKDRIRAGSMAFLQGCLGEDDIVIPCGDGFLIIYAQGEAVTLAAHSVALQGMLTEFYCGQEGLSALKVEVEHRRVDAAEITGLIEAASAPAPARDIKFTPIWTARGALIASYLATPMRNGAPGYDAEYRDEARHGARDYLDLDLAALDAVRAAPAAPAGTVQPTLGASVHASTLANRVTRAAYLRRLADMERSRHFFVRVAEIERGAPLLSVADWVGFLRAYVPQVLLEFHPTDGAIAALDRTGAWGAGFALPERIGEDDLVRLKLWGARLQHMRMRFFVGGARTEALMRESLAAGAHFLTSEAHWPSMKRPHGVIASDPFSPPQKALIP